MKSTDDQGLIPVIVASEADSTYIRAIPTAQPTSGDGSVSLDLGLPPECATAVAAGGKRPEMKDMNGIWNLFSRAIQSLQAYRGVYNASFATAIGGYPEYALVSDSSGNFWVSTADQNLTVPGATDATWQSLFDGYATESWSNGQFLQLANAAEQAVVGPVTFSGITTVPTPTDYTKKQAIGASDADARYVKKTGDTMNGPLTLTGAYGVATGYSWSEALTLENQYSGSTAQILCTTQYGVDTTIRLKSIWGNNNNTVLDLHQDGTITTTYGTVAFQSDLPLPVGMHVQIFDVTIPQGTNIGNGTDPFVANLPRGFSNFVAVFGNDVGNSIYTVACAVRNGAQVNLWVQTPQHTGGGLSGPVVVQLAAYGYY